MILLKGLPNRFESNFFVSIAKGCLRILLMLLLTITLGACDRERMNASESFTLSFTETPNDPSERVSRFEVWRFEPNIKPKVSSFDRLRREAKLVRAEIDADARKTAHAFWRALVEKRRDPVSVKPANAYAILIYSKAQGLAVFIVSELPPSRGGYSVQIPGLSVFGLEPESLNGVLF